MTRGTDHDGAGFVLACSLSVDLLSILNRSSPSANWNILKKKKKCRRWSRRNPKNHTLISDMQSYERIKNAGREKQNNKNARHGHDGGRSPRQEMLRGPPVSEGRTSRCSRNPACVGAGATLLLQLPPPPLLHTRTQPKGVVVASGFDGALGSSGDEVRGFVLDDGTGLLPIDACLLPPVVLDSSSVSSSAIPYPIGTRTLHALSFLAQPPQAPGRPDPHRPHMPIVEQDRTCL